VPLPLLHSIKTYILRSIQRPTARLLWSLGLLLREDETKTGRTDGVPAAAVAVAASTPGLLGTAALIAAAVVAFAAFVVAAA
jgi:hypothetical protein